MSAAIFFFGFTSGAAVMILWALYLAASPKKAEPEQNNNISATSISMSGANADESFSEAVQKILRNAEDKTVH